jgi:hypothetical protein
MVAKRRHHEVAASSLTSESRSWSRGSSIEGDRFGEEEKTEGTNAGFGEKVGGEAKNN